MRLDTADLGLPWDSDNRQSYPITYKSIVKQCSSAVTRLLLADKVDDFNSELLRPYS
jgi:hypothetical protein